MLDSPCYSSCNLLSTPMGTLVDSDHGCSRNLSDPSRCTSRERCSISKHMEFPGTTFPIYYLDVMTIKQLWKSLPSDFMLLKQTQAASQEEGGREGGCSYICFAWTLWHSAGQLLQGFLGSWQGISHPPFAMADVQWSGSFSMTTRAGEDPGLEEKHWGVLALHLIPEGQIGSSQLQL